MQPPYFVRRTVTCRHCEARQVRWSGSGVALVNALFAVTGHELLDTSRACRRCFHDLYTGERTSDLPVITAVSFLLHAVVGVGIGALVFGFLAIARPSLLEAPMALRVTPMAVGAVAGVLACRWQMRQRRPF